MIDQSGRAQSVLTAIKAPDGGSFDSSNTARNVREVRPLMAQSAELMSELPTLTDGITALEGYDAMRPDTLQIVDALRQIAFRRGQARCRHMPRSVDLDRDAKIRASVWQ
jgi:hypothetical protein